MRIWPGCVQSTQCLFQNDWKVFENFKDKFKYFFSTEHKEETKLDQKNSTGPHTGIVFVKHNEILPGSLVSTRCVSKWNVRTKFEIFGDLGYFFEEALALRFMTAQRKRLSRSWMAQI